LHLIQLERIMWFTKRIAAVIPSYTLKFLATLGEKPINRFADIG
jgi:hypothetical protein